MRKRTQSMLRRIPVWGGLFLVLLLAALVGTVLASGVTLGLFELDGNANTGDITPPADDWQALVANTHYDDGSGTDAAAFQTWSTILSDPGHGSGPNVTDGTTFMTGGSKDINNITQWRWTAGSIPAKDDITNAYAAAYTNPENSHLIIYFGADRYANNGSAQMGFWFLKGSLPKPLPTDGTFGTAAHQVGDILVLANFSGSAVLNGFAVYEWVGTGGDQKGGTLNTLIPPENAACAPGSAPPTGCAISNSTDIPLYWAYTAKSPTSPVPSQCTAAVTPGVMGCAPPASFFEGGVDLTALLNTTPCLATFLAETRSSSGSVTAQLEDFVYGSFPVCGFSVNKTCGGGTPDGNYIQYTYGGVVTNPHGTLSDVTVTDAFPSDVKDIKVGGVAASSCSSNVCTFDIGNVDAGYCQTWPNVRPTTADHGFPCSDLKKNGGTFTPDFSENTFETKTNEATNTVSTAYANGDTVTGTQDDGSALPLDASCPPGPTPSLTAAKSCSVSVSSASETGESSELVISVGDRGSVCNESGYTITNLAGTDVQTDTNYRTLSGGMSATLAFDDYNTGDPTSQLEACASSTGCNTANQTTYPGTCATFTNNYNPSMVSDGTDACSDEFKDVITVTGNYLGGEGTTDQVTTYARAHCSLCDCGSSPTTSSAITTTSTTSTTRHGRSRH